MNEKNKEEARCPFADVVGQDFNADQTLDANVAHEVYARLRKSRPVAYSASYGGFWALTRYEDILNVLSKPGSYVTSVQNVVPKVAFTGRRPPLHLDPPEHTPYRAALNPLLTSERVSLLEPVIRKIVVDLLEHLVRNGHGDICNDFGRQMPVRVFAKWMNLPADLEDALNEAGPAFIKAVEDFRPDDMKSTSLVLYEMARKLLALRKASPMDPQEDPTSALLAARFNGEPLDDEMIVGTVRQVLVVGIVAPLIVIGSIAIHLSRDRALQTHLRQNLQDLPAAIEEFLRLHTPYRGFARTATDVVEIQGQEIGPDEPIALVFASANRDEAVFERGSEFILNRENIKQHIAFGHGPHFCPGATLARLQLKVTLEELLTRTEEFSLDGEIEYAPSPEIGPRSVPMRFIAARRADRHSMNGPQEPLRDH